jgi:uncharacterized lipoprotein YmbA
MSTTLMRFSILLIFGGTLLAAACTVLPAQKDMSQFFILSPSPQAGEPARTDNQHELSIGLGPINFPGYLKRREIVTRISDDRLQLSENKRWAESLDANFQRVLSQDLATQLSTQRIVLFPWYGRPELDYQVEVQVHRFDTDAASRSELNARWIIEDGKSGRELFATESNISSAVAPTDIAGSEALSNDVNTLSAQIARSVRRLAEAPGAAMKPPRLPMATLIPD